MHFSFSAPAAEQASEVSPAYGLKVPSTALVVSITGALPQAIAMEIDLNTYRRLNISDVRREMDSI